jgi:hypothetical protein|nr:MAG TPA: hypothetical protein [Caudoviricetes sp.]
MNDMKSAVIALAHSVLLEEFKLSESNNIIVITSSNGFVRITKDGDNALLEVNPGYCQIVEPFTCMLDGDDIRKFADVVYDTLINQ